MSYFKTGYSVTLSVFVTNNASDNAFVTVKDHIDRL